MKTPTICRYCGGKVILTTARAIYGKGDDPIYLCTMCNAYVGCYKGTTTPMGKPANAVLRLKRQETHRSLTVSGGNRAGHAAQPIAGWRTAFTAGRRRPTSV